MTRLMVLFSVIATPAFAHPGHWEALAGHDPVGAGVLIGIALGLGALGVFVGKKDDEEEAEELEGAEA